MKDRIKGLTKIIKELIKLLEQLNKLIWEVGSIIALICYILEHFQK